MTIAYDAENDALERLMVEVGLSSGETASDSDPAEEAGVEAFLQSAPSGSAETETLEDSRNARILEQTERWIRFLRGQARQLTDVASRLYQSLLTYGVLSGIASATSASDVRDEVIDRLEWTLAGLEYWIEEQKPQVDHAKFCIVWKNGDGFASWIVDGENRTELTSVLAVVQDAAETEGDFSADVSSRIAAQITRDLESEELQLMHFRRDQQESRSSRTVFEFLERGEAYKLALAQVDESMTAIPPEVEACLSSEKAQTLARLVDAAIYEATEALCANSSPSALDTANGSNTSTASQRPAESEMTPVEVGDRSLTELTRLVDRAAHSCDIRRSEVVLCLFSVANHRLQTSRLRRDQASILRYGGVLNYLVPLVLRDQKT